MDKLIELHSVDDGTPAHGLMVQCFNCNGDNHFEHFKAHGHFHEHGFKAACRWCHAPFQVVIEHVKTSPVEENLQHAMAHVADIVFEDPEAVEEKPTQTERFRKR